RTALAAQPAAHDGALRDPRALARLADADARARVAGGDTALDAPGPPAVWIGEHARRDAERLALDVPVGEAQPHDDREVLRQTGVDRQERAPGADVDAARTPARLHRHRAQARPGDTRDDRAHVGLPARVENAR